MASGLKGRSPILWAVVCSIALSACQYANFATISRQTKLPMVANPTDGLAIHLDAQQRLLIYGRNGNYCAEPSPDALASFAASLGAAAAVPGQGTGSLSTAFNSAAASIGLRTQSITLMRDALYRICEARANGELNNVDATLLLTRSQDLTAVVVAVEQLTGAVAANQAALTGTANSGATAELLTDQISLEAANKEVAAKESELTSAKTEQAAEATELSKKEQAVKEANDAYTMAMAMPPPMPPPDLPALQTQLDTAKRELADEQLKKRQADSKVTIATQARDNAIANRQAIENHQNSLRTAVNASAATAAQFSSIAARNQLSKEATQAIADAVSQMVTKVLEKNYTIETCTLLISNGLQDDKTREMCYALISATAALQASQLNAAIPRDASFAAALPTAVTIRDRLASLTPDQAVLVAKAMEQFLPTRRPQVQELLRQNDPMRQRLTNGNAAKQILVQWAIVDDRDAASIKQWNDAIDMATK